MRTEYKVDRLGRHAARNRSCDDAQVETGRQNARTQEAGIASIAKFRTRTIESPITVLNVVRLCRTPECELIHRGPLIEVDSVRPL